MNRKRVLFLVNIPAPYRVDFFNELGKYSHLSVTFEATEATDRETGWQNVQPQTFTPIYLKGIRTRSDQGLCPGVITVIQKKWDHIIVGNYSTPTGMMAISYLRWKRIPFWIEVDGGLIKEDSKLLFDLKKRLISSASWWLSSGKPVDDYLVHYGAHRDRIFHYPFSSLRAAEIQQDYALNKKKEEIKERLGMHEDHIVLTVAQMIPRKGIDVLMKAASVTDRSIGFHVIGGEPTKEMRELADRLSLRNVHFHGFKNKEELNEIYSVADIFVLPTRFDIWGLVINEAMSHGLPVITTDKCVAGLTLVRDGENGYIVPADDSKAIASRIEVVFKDDTELRKRMSREAIKTARHFTIEEMTRSHVEALRL